MNKRLKKKIGNTSVPKWIRDDVKHGYVDGAGTPLKCFHCGCKKFHNVDEYWEETYKVEYKEKCDSCGKTVGHWAYGNWQW